jgi:hypothetical protein
LRTAKIWLSCYTSSLCALALLFNVSLNNLHRGYHPESVTNVHLQSYFKGKLTNALVLGKIQTTTDFWIFKMLLWYENIWRNIIGARICKRLWTPGIGSWASYTFTNTGSGQTSISSSQYPNVVPKESPTHSTYIIQYRNLVHVFVWSVKS